MPGGFDSYLFRHANLKHPPLDSLQRAKTLRLVLRLKEPARAVIFWINAEHFVLGLYFNAAWVSLYNLRISLIPAVQTMAIWTFLLFACLAVLLMATAFLPLFDVNFLIHRMSVANESVQTNYLAIRSATFASLAFFVVNFLRHKRPLSSVAPMLAFCNFLVFFGAALMIKRADFEVLPWFFLSLIAVLSIFLFRENKAQASTIFRDSW